MLTLSSTVRIFLCHEPVDMRRGFDRLAEEVRQVSREDPMSGHLFVFRNKRADRLKVLSWDRNGYAVWYKRLERGRFLFPARLESGDLSVDPVVFQLLVGGALRRAA